MTIDEIKKFQARLGVQIEVARNMGHGTTENTLTQAMKMSSEYERLVRQVQYFIEKLDPTILEVSDTW